MIGSRQDHIAQFVIIKINAFFKSFTHVTDKILLMNKPDLQLFGKKLVY